jgi:AbrB family looped-hinge helix DNA binding protein
MADATVTSKGQVTIPADVRRASNLQPGDTISFTPMPDGTVLLRAKTRSLDQVAGLLHRPGRRPVPTERLGLGPSAPSKPATRRR